MQKIKKEFLLDDEAYENMIANLQKEPSIRLTSGNCGIFAVALLNLTKCGTVVVLDDENENNRGYSHCLFKAYNKYFDGKAIYYDVEEITTWQGNMYSCRNLFDDEERKVDAIDGMIQGTCNRHTIPEMEKLIIKHMPAKYVRKSPVKKNKEK